jgi:hypothetical protein
MRVLIPLGGLLWSISKRTHANSGSDRLWSLAALNSFLCQTLDVGLYAYAYVTVKLYQVMYPQSS